MDFLPDSVVEDLKVFMKKKDEQGYHYTIVVYNPEHPKPESNLIKYSGDYEFHDRPNQPCIGGNLRKYGDDGLNDCHPAERAKDYSPNDLNNKPENAKYKFPAGRPSGVAYYNSYLSNKCKPDPYVSLCFSDKSPWVKGFGCADAVIWTDQGYIIKTGDIDPTLLISLTKHLQGMDSHKKVFDELVKRGVPENKAVAFAAYTSGSYGQNFGETGEYSWDGMNNFKRVVNQDPVNLTGGLWSDRYDYHRPDLALVFREKTKDKVNLIQLVNQKAKETKDAYSAAVQVIEQLTSE